FISTLSTGTKPIDVTSTTVCTNLNADKVDGIDGTNFVRKDDATLQAIISNLQISKSNPQMIWTDGTKQLRIEILGSNYRFVNDRLSTTWMQVDETTDVATFSQIPVLPASNPTTDNQAARKKYVDDTVAAKTAAFSQAWFYAVPPAATETTESVPRFIAP